jgi:hypothetical protein
MKVWRVAVGGVVLLAGVLGLGAPGWGQNQDKNAQTGTAQESTVPKKPVRKMEFVTTTDPVALLAVRRAREIVEAPTLLPTATATETASTPGDESTKKAAEVAETEKLINEKQKKIVLLLRLFATDEQMFLRDPSAAEKDPSVKERRKYSQDELLWETAELARLKKRMIELERK